MSRKILFHHQAGGSDMRVRAANKPVFETVDPQFRLLPEALLQSIAQEVVWLGRFGDRQVLLVDEQAYYAHGSPAGGAAALAAEAVVIQ